VAVTPAAEVGAESEVDGACSAAVMAILPRRAGRRRRASASSLAESNVIAMGGDLLQQPAVAAGSLKEASER
jgi:hypothetical protein